MERGGGDDGAPDGRSRIPDDRKEPRNPGNGRGPCAHGLNAVKKLHLREIGVVARVRASPGRMIASTVAITTSFCGVIFDKMQFQKVIDVFNDMGGLDSLELRFLRRRCRIADIISIKDILIARTTKCLCFALSRATNKVMPVLNQPEEIIESMFFNRLTDSLITVSACRSDDYMSKTCRSTNIALLRTNQANHGHRIFGENLTWPVDILFDELNGIAIILSKKDGQFRIFCLKDYSLLYSLHEQNLRDMHSSSGNMLLTLESNTDLLPLRIRSIETGDLISAFNHLVEHKVELLAYINGKVLIRGQRRGLQLIDAFNHRNIEIEHEKVKLPPPPRSFYLIHKRSILLTFHRAAGHTHMLDLQGNVLNTLEDNTIPCRNGDVETNLVCLTLNDSIIMSLCKNKGVMSINISCLGCGKCIRKLCTSDPRLLSDVAELSYNEDLNEVYTGNESGQIMIWSMPKSNNHIC